MTTEDLELVWQEISRIETCMMITHDSGAIRARPMVGTPDRQANMIWFVASRENHKDEEVAADPRICLTYADPGSNTYVSVSGRGAVVTDRSKLEALWTPSIDAWFEGGPEDPDAILIGVRPEMAEYWDNPNSDLIVALKMLTTTSDEAPAIGDNRKVVM
ncbi:pyridoxamine 5'-phosphate oxidase family protein [Acuticoccus mangrovi]|uniref:Pyridoxamine 5'-phosphate oxidase family protein n=1 Tax=Acuticoccus mangrovi TaxID=2796142 RepID=A0A934ILS2_9HYPH|nr:pyridoxamine 5'-phosphate oxidase family protein [Acuticoccus mangrovi]MBJ3774592.1 pyridoxamine 5'-phosphate oxidase family protein [Acuticoccus mangrovi]